MHFKYLTSRFKFSGLLFLTLYIHACMCAYVLLYVEAINQNQHTHILFPLHKSINSKCQQYGKDDEQENEELQQDHNMENCLDINLIN